jgi:hypothetical protein
VPFSYLHRQLKYAITRRHTCIRLYILYSMGKSPLVPTFVSFSGNLSCGMRVGYFQSDPDRKFHSGHKPEIGRLLKIGGKRGCADRQANYEFIQRVHWLQLHTNFRTVRSWRIPANRIKLGPRFCSIKLDKVEYALEKAPSIIIRDMGYQK